MIDGAERARKAAVRGGGLEHFDSMVRDLTARTELHLVESAQKRSNNGLGPKAGWLVETKSSIWESTSPRVRCGNRIRSSIATCSPGRTRPRQPCWPNGCSKSCSEPLRVSDDGAGSHRHRSRTTLSVGCEQQIRTLPAAGGSTGSGS